MIFDGQVRYHDALEPFMVPIDSVRQHPENYNNGDVDEIIEFILDVGMYQPLKVQSSTTYIAAGNTTWEACASLGAQRIPAVMLDIDDDTCLKIMVGDNELARLARPDRGQLTRLLTRIKETEGTMPHIGKTEEDLENLKRLAQVPVAYANTPGAAWPSITFTVPQHLKEAFYEMTESATGDYERFELLMRMAGYE